MKYRLTVMALTALVVATYGQITIEHGPIVLQYGTEAALNTWTGAAHQVVHNITDNSIHVSDGATEGGHKIERPKFTGNRLRYLDATTNAVENGTRLLELYAELEALYDGELLNGRLVESVPTLYLNAGIYDIGANTLVLGHKVNIKQISGDFSGYTATGGIVKRGESRIVSSADYETAFQFMEESPPISPIFEGISFGSVTNINGDVAPEYSPTFRGCQFQKIDFEKQATARFLLEINFEHCSIAEINYLSGPLGTEIYEGHLITARYKNCWVGDYIPRYDEADTHGTPIVDSCVIDNFRITRGGFLPAAKGIIRDSVINGADLFDCTGFAPPPGFELIFSSCDFINTSGTWFVNKTLAAGDVVFRNCSGVSSTLVGTAAQIIGCTDENGALITDQ